jgi:hypothetical protein
MRQLTLVLALTMGLPLLGQSELEAVLRTAADYIAQYEREITAVSAEEDYVQRVPTHEGGSRPGVAGPTESLTIRRLRSHLVLIAEPATGWVEFRDVFEVDGTPVRDRQERLVRLFLTPGNDQQGQAARIVQESARFNLSPPRATFRRTLNVPMTALRFLRAANQPRSTFELRGTERQNGRTLLAVRFKEQGMPRLIGSNEGSAAHGSFWIDSKTGAVAKSEIEMIHQRVAAKLTVKYAEHPTAKLWLPVSMEEVYTLAGGQASTVFGQATYANVKRFRVETSTNIK